MKTANLRGLAAVAALALGLASAPAGATTYSTDYSDLWWNADESGWGVNVIQQYDTVFATLFTYGTDGTPRWYVASSLTPTGAATGITAFTGGLYATTGPYFGGPFFPNTATLVGSMTFSFNSYSTGTLSYVVNGVTVNKEITRQTWRGNNLAGKYLGGVTAIGANCNGVPNGPILIFGNLSINQNAQAVGARIDFTSAAGQTSFCNFSGAYNAQGRMGTISQGAWSCTFGGQQLNSGTFTLTSIDAGVNGITAAFTATDQYCFYSGKFGGLRDVL